MGKELFIDNYIFSGRRCFYRGIFYIIGFIIEDCMEKFFFWSWVRFFFRSNFIDQDIVFMYLCINLDNIVFVEVFGGFFIDVWDIVGQFFFIEFGVLDVYFEVFDVDGSEDIFVDYMFREYNSIFKVVVFLWYECYFQVLF